MSLKSFRDARSAFKTNLTNVLAKLNYTPASLSMKLNNAAQMGGSVKSVVSASDIQDWTSGKKVPSLYAYFKLTDYLRLTMDELVDPNFNLATVIGRSFAAQSSAAPKIVCPTVPEISAEDLKDLTELSRCAHTPLDMVAIPVDKVETSFMVLGEEYDLLAPYVEKVEVTIAPARSKAKPVKVPSTGTVKNAAQLHATLVDKHSLSPKRNDKLAYAVLTSGKTVQDVAKSVGVAPRTLRDYMYYGVTVPEHVGKALLKVLHSCNYTTLGLKFDSNKTRYTHV